MCMTAYASRQFSWASMVPNAPAFSTLPKAQRFTLTRSSKSLTLASFPFNGYAYII